MAYYNRLDIALDPVNVMSGTTTTSDALWMGVPVITLTGNCLACRMTTSILSSLGHSDWAVPNEEEFIDKVAELSRDVELRRSLRATQRGRMANSALCNARDLATNLENAYLEMFERWLNGKSRRIT